MRKYSLQCQFVLEGGELEPSSLSKQHVNHRIREPRHLISRFHAQEVIQEFFHRRLKFGPRYLDAILTAVANISLVTLSDAQTSSGIEGTSESSFIDFDEMLLATVQGYLVADRCCKLAIQDLHKLLSSNPFSCLGDTFSLGRLLVDFLQADIHRSGHLPLRTFNTILRNHLLRPQTSSIDSTLSLNITMIESLLKQCSLSLCRKAAAIASNQLPYVDFLVSVLSYLEKAQYPISTTPTTADVVTAFQSAIQEPRIDMDNNIVSVLLNYVSTVSIHVLQFPSFALWLQSSQPSSRLSLLGGDWNVQASLKQSQLSSTATDEIVLTGSTNFSTARYTKSIPLTTIQTTSEQPWIVPTFRDLSTAHGEVARVPTSSRPRPYTDSAAKSSSLVKQLTQANDGHNQIRSLTAPSSHHLESDDSSDFLSEKDNNALTDLGSVISIPQHIMAPPPDTPSFESPVSIGSMEVKSRRNTATSVGARRLSGDTIPEHVMSANKSKVLVELVERSKRPLDHMPTPEKVVASLSFAPHNDDVFFAAPPITDSPTASYQGSSRFTFASRSRCATPSISPRLSVAMQQQLESFNRHEASHHDALMQAYASGMKAKIQAKSKKITPRSKGLPSSNLSTPTNDRDSLALRLISPRPLGLSQTPKTFPLLSPVREEKVRRLPSLNNRDGDIDMLASSSDLFRLGTTTAAKRDDSLSTPPSSIHSKKLKKKKVEKQRKPVNMITSSIGLERTSTMSSQELSTEPSSPSETMSSKLMTRSSRISISSDYSTSTFQEPSKYEETDSCLNNFHCEIDSILGSNPEGKVESLLVSAAALSIGMDADIISCEDQSSTKTVSSAIHDHHKHTVAEVSDDAVSTANSIFNNFLLSPAKAYPKRPRQPLKLQSTSAPVDDSQESLSGRTLNSMVGFDHASHIRGGDASKLRSAGKNFYLPRLFASDIEYAAFTLNGNEEADDRQSILLSDSDQHPHDEIFLDIIERLQAYQQQKVQAHAEARYPLYLPNDSDFIQMFVRNQVDWKSYFVREKESSLASLMMQLQTISQAIAKSETNSLGSSLDVVLPSIVGNKQNKSSNDSGKYVKLPIYALSKGKVLEHSIAENSSEVFQVSCCDSCIMSALSSR
jgi:hypothetical protein